MNEFSVQSFEMNNTVLRYDADRSTLLCSSKDGKKLWIKKLDDLNAVSDIIEDSRRYYLICDSGEINGQFIAVQKDGGTTEWFIPGKSFMHLFYGGFLYLIFADEEERFFLLKVNPSDGKSVWFFQVDRDLIEYRFAGDAINLRYSSGRMESVEISSGRELVQNNDIVLRRV